MGTQSQESFWEHKEEHNKQVKEYRAYDSSAVEVTLGDYATRFPETGHIESQAPHKRGWTILNYLVFAAKTAVLGFSPTVGKMR